MVQILLVIRYKSAAAYRRPSIRDRSGQPRLITCKERSYSADYYGTAVPTGVEIVTVVVVAYVRIVLCFYEYRGTE